MSIKPGGPVGGFNRKEGRKSILVRCPSRGGGHWGDADALFVRWVQVKRKHKAAGRLKKGTIDEKRYGHNERWRCGGLLPADETAQFLPIPTSRDSSLKRSTAAIRRSA